MGPDRQPTLLEWMVHWWQLLSVKVLLAMVQVCISLTTAQTSPKWVLCEEAYPKAIKYTKKKCIVLYSFAPDIAHAHFSMVWQVRLLQCSVTPAKTYSILKVNGCIHQTTTTVENIYNLSDSSAIHSDRCLIKVNRQPLMAPLTTCGPNTVNFFTNFDIFTKTI